MDFGIVGNAREKVWYTVAIHVLPSIYVSIIMVVVCSATVKIKVSRRTAVLQYGSLKHYILLQLHVDYTASEIVYD